MSRGHSDTEKVLSPFTALRWGSRPCEQRSCATGQEGLSLSRRGDGSRPRGQQNAAGGSAGFLVSVLSSPVGALSRVTSPQQCPGFT